MVTDKHKQCFCWVTVEQWLQDYHFVIKYFSEDGHSKSIVTSDLQTFRERAALLNYWRLVSEELYSYHPDFLQLIIQTLNIKASIVWNDDDRYIQHRTNVLLAVD